MYEEIISQKLHEALENFEPNKTKIENTYDVVHYFIIEVHDKRGGLGKLIERLEWKNLRFELRQKYDWYFKYRASLLQVKYPRYIVDCFWGNEPAQGKALEEIKKQKIASKKSVITKSENKLSDFVILFEKYKREYLEIFPIEEQMEYKRFVASIDLATQKINRLKRELFES